MSLQLGVQSLRSAPSRAAVVVDHPALLKRRPGRPTCAEAEALRDAILNAAMRSFMDRGFEASSMDGIARDAGVARMTLYRHFASKEEMFQHVTRRAQLKVCTRIEQAIDLSRPFKDVLRDIIGALYDSYTHPDYVATFRMVAAESRRFPKLGRAMFNDMKLFSQPLIRYLGQLQKQGVIAISTPLEAAIQVSGMASGAGRYQLVSPSRHPVSRKHWVDSLTELFVRAWQA